MSGVKLDKVGGVFRLGVNPTPYISSFSHMVATQNGVDNSFGKYTVQRKKVLRSGNFTNVGQIFDRPAKSASK
jgi:hypothetical protein